MTVGPERVSEQVSAAVHVLGLLDGQCGPHSQRRTRGQVLDLTADLVKSALAVLADGVAPGRKCQASSAIARSALAAALIASCVRV